MRNGFYLALTAFVVLLSSSFLHAQSNNNFKIEEFNYRVTVKNRGPIMVDSAFMEKVVRNENGEPKETFQLSFVIPKQLENQMDNTTLKLTVYDKTGKVFGMRVWHKVPRTGISNTDTSGIPIVLEVNPEFAKATKFSLDAGILEINAGAGETSSATCPGCVDLAVTTSGAGRVESVKCGTTKDGSTCEFKCKP